MANGPITNTTTANTTSNRHPVDEIAAVRDMISALKAREAELRDMILAGECSLVGDEHAAEIKTIQQSRMDTAALKRDLGLDLLAPYTSQVDVTQVRVVDTARQRTKSQALEAVLR